MATGLVRQADKTALMAYRVNKLYRPLALFHIDDFGV